MNNYRGLLITALIAIATAGTVLAQQEHKSEPGNEDHLSAGVGLILSHQPYKGLDYNTTLIPMFDYRKGKFYSRGKRIGYEIFTEENWNLDIIGEMRFDGYERGDSSALSGMDDRDWTVEAGLSWVYDMKDYGEIELSWLFDILDQHGGNELGLSYGYPMRYDKLRITPSVGFKWQSDDLVDYYYGVQGKEARPWRPAYNADSTVNWFTAMTIMYDLNEQWSLFTNLTWTFYGSEISDSPIVDEDSGLSALFGIMYNF